MLVVIIILLSIVFIIEFINSLARLGGISLNSFAAGMTIQSAIGIVARTASTMMMPLLGVFSDLGKLAEMSIETIYIQLLIMPAMILCAFFSRDLLLKILLSLVHGVVGYGKLQFANWSQTNQVVYTYRKIKLFRKLKIYFILTYIPFYGAWPIAIILMSIFPEYRATILTSSAVLTGFNSFFMTIVVDPYTTYLANRAPLIAKSFLYNMLHLKLYALFLSFVLVGIFVIIYGELY